MGSDVLCAPGRFDQDLSNRSGAFACTRGIGSQNIPGQACGRLFLQALDLEPSCTTSNVILVGK